MLKIPSSARTYAMAAIISLGLAAAWCLIILWIIGIMESASHGRRRYEQLYVSRTGEPYILRYANGIYSSQQEVLNLSREPVKGDLLLNPMYTGRRIAGPSHAYRLAAANDGGVPATYWYLLHDGKFDGRAYGVGYHSLTKQVVGYFGRKGFANRQPPRDEWFQVTGSGLSSSTPAITWTEPQLNESVLFLLSEGKLWSIDPRKREIRTLADAPSNASTGWAWDLTGKGQKPPAVYAATVDAPKRLLVRSDEFLMLVDPDSDEQASYPLPPDLRKDNLAACQLPDGNLLLIANGVMSGRSGYRVMWIEPGGRVLRSSDLQLAQLGVGGSGEEAFSWIAALAVPFLAGQAVILLLIPSIASQSGQFETYWEAVGHTFMSSWPALLILVAMGVIVAVATYRRQKRFGLPGAIPWAVFAFVFGIPGWISYRLHRRWPVLEECPACQQSAPRDRDACIECGAEFPTPALKGIEVFA
jgi:hypothetical protein